MNSLKTELNQTVDKCLKYVQYDGNNLRYVKDHIVQCAFYEDICLEAVKQNNSIIIIKYVEKYYPSVAKLVVFDDYLSLAPKNNDIITLHGVKYKKI